MKKYIVWLWCGSGYLLTPFEVEAESSEEALEKVSVILINENLTSYYSDVTKHEKFCRDYLHTENEFKDESSIYVDGTMEGAKYPIWINAENLKIEEITNKIE